jgi:predicted DNA-binding transcriptional regulator AlpA
MLPELLRFRDLKRVGINNWVTLRRRVEKDGFPPGRLLGPATRVWTTEEVENWFNSRPTKRAA